MFPCVSHCRNLAMVALASLAMVSCASPLQQIPFDHAGAQAVRTIGVVTPRFPEKASMAFVSEGPVIGPPLAMMLGAALQAGIRADRDATLHHALASQDYAARDEFTSDLTAALRDGGYNVVLLPMARDGSGFAHTYSAVDLSKVDALLDVVVGRYGFEVQDTGYSGRCAPYVSFQARLVGARSSSVIMQHSLVYGLLLKEKGAVAIPDSQQDVALTHCFNELERTPVVAVKGLRAASKASAAALAGLLH